MSLFKRYYPVLVAVLVAVLPLGMNTYWTEVAVNVGLYALLALSLNVILGQAGIFHMGHAAFYAVGAYVTAILNTHYQIPILLLIPVAGAAAALFALVVARPIIHLRGDYLLIVTIGIILFAYSTILGWSYYGEKAIEYLLGSKAIVPYRWAFIISVGLGSSMKLDLVWVLSDIFNALMAFPNLIGLIMLTPVVKAETMAYLRSLRQGSSSES